MGNDEIISAIMQSYKYNMSEEELEQIISHQVKLLKPRRLTTRNVYV